MTGFSQHASRIRLNAIFVSISSSLILYCASEQSPAGKPTVVSPSSQNPKDAQNGTDVQAILVAPFGKIALCVPFTTAVQPSDSHHITINAQPQVARRIGVTVTNGILRLDISAVVATAAIRVTIGLPSTALKDLSTSGVGSVIIFPGFTSDNLTISASGTGSVLAHGINATRAQVLSTGTSGIELSGSIGAADITTFGTGRTDIAGLMISAAVRASGTSSINLQTVNGSAVISGAVQGLAKVYYSDGICNIQESIPKSPFGLPCQRREYAPANTSSSWTCNVNITASFSCNGGTGSSLSTGSVQCPPVDVPAGSAVSGSSAVAPGTAQAPTPAPQPLITIPAAAPYPSTAAVNPEPASLAVYPESAPLAPDNAAP